MRSPASAPSTRIPEQIHQIVTRPGISRPPVSNTSTYRTVASAGSVTGCASRPLTCGSNRLIDDRQVRAYVGGLPVFAVDRIGVRAPMSADERQSADALGRSEAVSLYE